MPVRILEPRWDGETIEQYLERREHYEEELKADEEQLRALRERHAERVGPKPSKNWRTRW